MAAIKFVLDSRRARKDGTYPLVFRVTYNRQYFHIPIGVFIDKEGFDTETGLVLNNEKLNIELSKKMLEYRERIYHYLTSVPNGNLKGLKLALENETPNQVTIGSFWLNEIDRLTHMKKYGNARVYSHSYQAVSKHLNLDIPFHQLTLKNILDLETKFYAQGVSVNGLSVYLRTFRAICNKAIFQDYVGLEWYPFRKYKIRKEKTTPRVLSETELRKFFQLDIPDSHHKYKYWCIGKLLFMLRGINVIDLIQLKPENIKSGRLIYRRAKTSKLYSIKLTPEIEQVLNEFSRSHTLLDLLTKKEMESTRFLPLVKQKNKLINKHLSDLGEMIESNEKITTYVFRYSYANLAKKLGYSKDLIAEALGHEYGNSTTGIYLEQFDMEVVDQMNSTIINYLVRTDLKKGNPPCPS
jgi:integrase/recombinase XerD